MWVGVLVLFGVGVLGLFQRDGRLWYIWPIASFLVACCVVSVLYRTRANGLLSRRDHRVTDQGSPLSWPVEIAAGMSEVDSNPSAVRLLRRRCRTPQVVARSVAVDVIGGRRLLHRLLRRPRAGTQLRLGTTSNRTRRAQGIARLHPARTGVQRDHHGLGRQGRLPDEERRVGLSLGAVRVQRPVFSPWWPLSVEVG